MKAYSLPPFIMANPNMPPEAADLPIGAVEGVEPMEDTDLNKGLAGAIAKMRTAMTGSKE